MILQAHEYEELEGTPRRLQEFFDSTNGKSLLRARIALVLRTETINKQNKHFTEFVTSYLFFVLLGRFHHPHILQLVSSLNEERACYTAKTDEAKTSGESKTTVAESAQTHTSSHTS